MRTRNEKILLAILLAIVFGGGNFFGYRWLSERQQALDLKAAEMSADQEEAMVDLQKQPTWEQRKKWIEANEPPLGDEGDASGRVQHEVYKGASDRHLEVLEQNLGDVQHGMAGTRVSVELKVKGTMQDLCGWLAPLEKPESFYAVAITSMKVDSDQKSMDCTLQLSRYFKAGS